MTQAQMNEKVKIAQALVNLTDVIPTLPTEAWTAARCLRQLPEFRGLTRVVELGWDARFQDEDRRDYHGYSADDEHAVILAACRWKRLELDQATES